MTKKSSSVPDPHPDPLPRWEREKNAQPGPGAAGTPGSHGPQARATRKADSREALLDAGEQLFAEKGYAAVGTREIAERAGVNLGMIQYYFGSKGKLFIAVVQRMMRGGAAANASAAIQKVPDDPDAAAEAVCRFVQLFMGHLLASKRPQACRIMYREVLGDRESEPEVFEALVASVTDEFTQPLVESLAAVLGKLAPGATTAELELSAQSIIGQCVFYLTHRPFLERQCGKCLAEPPLFEDTAVHIARFSLRAIGCDEKRIERAVQAVFAFGGGARERGPPKRKRAVSR